MSNIYYPNYDSEQRAFVDIIPTNDDFKEGVKCHCGCLKKSAFKDKNTFENHLKTPTHKKWLEYFQNLPLPVQEESNQSLIHKQEAAIALLQYEIEMLKQEMEKQCILCWLTQ